MKGEGIIWRAIGAGKVTLGEVARGDVDLGHLLRLNAVLDFEAAAQAAVAQKD